MYRRIQHHRGACIVSPDNKYYCRSFIHVTRPSLSCWLSTSVLPVGFYRAVLITNRPSLIINNKESFSRSHQMLSPSLAPRLMRRDGNRGRYSFTDGFLLFLRLIRAIFVDRMYVWKSCSHPPINYCQLTICKLLHWTPIIEEIEIGHVAHIVASLDKNLSFSTFVLGSDHFEQRDISRHPILFIIFFFFF